MEEIAAFYLWHPVTGGQRRRGDPKRDTPYPLQTNTAALKTKQITNTGHRIETRRRQYTEEWLKHQRLLLQRNQSPHDAIEAILLFTFGVVTEHRRR